MAEPLTILSIHQWNKNGDHPLDYSKEVIGSDGVRFISEGKVIRRFKHPGIKGEDICKFCGKIFNDHGFIDNQGAGWRVCPGDYIAGTDALEGTETEYFPTRCIDEVMAGYIMTERELPYLTKKWKVETTLPSPNLAPKPFIDNTPRGKNETLQ